MKLPDGNKPIRVGDPSFIYKGVYNPIYWVGNDPYRPRVETLVIKDGRYLYANIKDNIDNIPPDRRTHSYSIPGGSLDADSTKIEQAEAETNEEALIKVTLLYHSGISYYELYEPGFILKGGDTPLEYVGSISDVYVGVYNGSYDKNLVGEKDLDPDMAEHGKFHKIISIAKYLRKEHVEALIGSQFVAEDVKIILRLHRNDIVNESTSPIVIPDRLLYHGSNFDIDEFKPMSLDLGNLYDEPGWSTFCFDNYNYAKIFGFMKTVQRYMDEILGPNKISLKFKNGKIEISKDDLDVYTNLWSLDTKYKFFVYTIDSNGLNIGIGNDPSLKEYTFRESGVIPKSKDIFELSMVDIKEDIEVVDEHESSRDYSDYKLIQTHNYQKEVEVRNELISAVQSGELKPGDNIREYMDEHGLYFANEDIPLPNITVDIDEPVLEDIDLSPMLDEKYPIECYGLPDRKAYPMPDEEHVRSAIKFFNYSDISEEKELARNINKKIKEFHITNISVGEKNRFKSYFKPINESYTLEDFFKILEPLAKKIKSNIINDSERLEVYNTMEGVVRMLIEYLEYGLISDIKNADHLLKQSYISLAEISQNQMEILSKQSVTESSVRSIRHVMEADDNDDDEVATDYEKMADDMSGDETSRDSTTDELGDESESVTDYDRVADDMDTEPEMTNNPNNDEEEFADEGEDSTNSSESNKEDETAADYDTMADDMDTDDNGYDSSDDEEDSEEPTDSADTSEETDENNNQYDNKELKNYFLLNSFLSIHETTSDVLDTVSGVILPTPDANSVLANVVKNLQSIKNFVERFIQFHFNNSDYAFNLYYYNILISALKMDLKLLEEAMNLGESKKSEKLKKED